MRIYVTDEWYPHPDKEELCGVTVEKLTQKPEECNYVRVVGNTIEACRAHYGDATLISLLPNNEMIIRTTELLRIKFFTTKRPEQYKVSHKDEDRVLMETAAAWVKDGSALFRFWHMDVYISSSELEIYVPYDCASYLMSDGKRFRLT